MDELQPEDPRRIGPYWLEARLGSGGMGCVYLGRSPGGRHVAIKVIRPELAEDAEFRARFAREVSAARKVSGIFTAPVIDADLEGPMPWLATSYVAGPSLADVVAARGPLPVESVLKLAAGLAEGLAAIHSAGVVHRDLKPANVLLADDGPRLIDFGISRSLDASTLTRTGMVVGSPEFMSPEQANGRGAGPASDIFSLGGVLAFAATGKGPFGDGSSISVLCRVVSSEPALDEVPDAVRPLIERCMAKDPRRRPTASALLAELSTVPPATQLSAPAARARPGPGDPGPGGADRGVALLARPAAGRGASPDVRRRGPPALTPRFTPREPRERPSAREPRYTPRDGPPVPLPGGTRPVAPTATAPELVSVYEAPETVAIPKRPRRRRRGWLIALAVVVTAVGVAAGAFLAQRAGHVTSPPPTTGQPSAGSSQAAQPPGAAAMTALNSYLVRSASVRPGIQPALDGVRSCSVSPASGEATMQRAIDTRQQILNDLRTLSVSGLPNGRELISALTTAMQESVNADRYYQSWMTDFESAGNPCGSDPNQNPNFVSGQKASVAATAAKRTFVGIWNPMAPRYEKPTYSSTDF